MKYGNMLSGIINNFIADYSIYTKEYSLPFLCITSKILDWSQHLVLHINISGFIIDSATNFQRKLVGCKISCNQQVTLFVAVESLFHFKCIIVSLLPTIIYCLPSHKISLRYSAVSDFNIDQSSPSEDLRINPF